jgi:hypothetical protein
MKENVLERKKERKYYFVLGCDAMQLGENRRFERKSPPSSGMNSQGRNQQKQEECSACLAFPSILKMEAICSCETSGCL